MADTTKKWEENVDYGTLIKEQIAAGADASQVRETLNTRVDKAKNTQGLEQFAYDDVYKEAMDYINTKDKEAALGAIDSTYGNMINQADKYYNERANAAKDWADKQTQIQQQQSEFAIEQLEKQKAQAAENYTNEQSAAYVDWQKQSNPYSVTSEALADAGLRGTGFSESSQVSMYNTYQNRVATARQAYTLAVTNYNTAIKDAQLQNSAALAEIAYAALQQQLELSLQGFQYKNQLILTQAEKKQEIENTYYNRYQDILQQINTENALAEQIRQFNEKMAEEQRQFDITTGLKSGKTTGGTYNPNSYTITNDPVKKGNTANANSKVGALQKAKSFGRSDDYIASAIAGYLTEGLINGSEAAYLYNKLGFDYTDYLEEDGT